MTSNVRDGGVFRDAREVHVQQGGVWRDCKQVWAREGGVHRRVFLQTTFAMLAGISPPLAQRGYVVNGAAGTLSPTGWEGQTLRDVLTQSSGGNQFYVQVNASSVPQSLIHGIAITGTFFTGQTKTLVYKVGVSDFVYTASSVQGVSRWSWGSTVPLPNDDLIRDGNSYTVRFWK